MAVGRYCDMVVICFINSIDAVRGNGGSGITFL